MAQFWRGREHWIQSIQWMMFKKHSRLVCRKSEWRVNKCESRQSWSLEEEYSSISNTQCWEVCFYNMLPDSTCTLKGETFKGMKVKKGRITYYMCKYGFEKHPLFVVDTTMNLQGQVYVDNSLTFYKFLVWLLRKITSKNRKIFVCINQCAAHPKSVGNLKNMWVKFLPANPTTLLQNTDKGIIRVLKN